MIKTTRHFLELEEAINKFITKNNREPTAIDFNEDDTLPSIRTLQRKYGGIKKIRETLGLKYIDHRMGTPRSITAAAAANRSTAYEKEMFEKLSAKYHDNTGVKKTVEKEVEYQQYGETFCNKVDIRSDVAIIDRENNHIIFFDFFFPTSRSSFGGCVRTKKKKLRDNPVTITNYTYEIIFVCVNNEFTTGDVKEMKINRDGFTLLSHDEFTERFLETPPKKITPNFFTKVDNSLQD